MCLRESHIRECLWEKREMRNKAHPKFWLGDVGGCVSPTEAELQGLGTDSGVRLTAPEHSDKWQLYVSTFNVCILSPQWVSL